MPSSGWDPHQADDMTHAMPHVSGWDPHQAAHCPVSPCHTAEPHTAHVGWCGSAKMLQHERNLGGVPPSEIEVKARRALYVVGEENRGQEGPGTLPDITCTHV